MDYENSLDRDTMLTELHESGLSYVTQFRNASGRAFSSLGLTYGQAMLLILVERGHTSPNELAQLLNIVAPALASTVTNLSEKGLLFRQNVESDGRRFAITLTSEGVSVCSRLKEAWRQYSPVDLNKLTNDELNVLIHAFQIAIRIREA